MPYSTETEYPRKVVYGVLASGNTLTFPTGATKVSHWTVQNSSSTAFTLTFRRPSAGATYFVQSFAVAVDGRHEYPVSFEAQDGLEILCTGATGVAYVTVHIVQ